MKMTNNQLEALSSLDKDLKSHKNAARAALMSKYMKNKFEFYGISSPKRKTIFASHKRNILSIVDSTSLDDLLIQCWEYEAREWQYIGLELLWSAKKHWSRNTIDLIEKLIVSKSWWDTVDMLAGKIAGAWFMKFPQQRFSTVNAWIKSDNMWLQRSAIIHQLGYKEKTDVDLLLRSIEPYIPSPEFFLRKAIGWALRQYSKTNPAWVKKIVRAYPLSPLSKREAERLMK
jgi:3-methyladenine DNA glycosylase AlkD